ncbi:MAG: hypothetical protein JO316_13640 [Abitibacteriaceae bacterium]|nr:hypothetical protein [Abditibacteriaceae bacterium]
MKSSILSIIIILLLAGAGVLWFNKSKGAGPVDKSAPFTIVATANWDAQIEPCGCSPNQPGGLSRLATVIQQQHLKNALMVDCGNVAASGYDPELTRFRYLLLGMQDLGYQVINLGANEVTMGASHIRYFRDNYPHLKFVSANVMDAQTGKSLVEPYQIVTLPTLKVGVTGVTTAGASQDLQIKKSDDAIKQVVSQLKGQVDLVVVLQDSPAKVMVYDRTGQLSWQGKVPDFGKAFKAQAALDHLSQPQLTTLDIPFKTKPAPDYVAKVNNYKRAVSSLEFDPSQFAPYSPFFGSKAKFVGDTTCATCHAQAHAIWQKTPHAHAMAVLQKNNDEGRPECVRCHSVGYALPTGFKTLKETPRLANVQCESCHGPGAAHVAYYQKPQTTQTHEPPDYGAVGQQFCVNCHDPENDPKYHKLGFARYWAKIKHGNESSDSNKLSAKPSVREMLAALDAQH